MRWKVEGLVTKKRTLYRGIAGQFQAVYERVYKRKRFGIDASEGSQREMGVPIRAVSIC